MICANALYLLSHRRQGKVIREGALVIVRRGLKRIRA
jgi:hypothetical protein